ncbi:hypothetical protein [Shimia sp.]
MLILRTYVTLLLVAVLVLTGHSLAIARGMPGAAGYAEYCIGQSAVMVPVDAEGNPTGAPHLCPDVSLSLLNWVEMAPESTFAIDGAARSIGVEAGRFPNVIRLVLSSARAPPVGVSIL